MSKPRSIKETMMRLLLKAFAVDTQASAQPLRLGSPSKTYEERQMRIAHAATLTGGKGFMSYSNKVKVGSERGNKRRVAKARLFHGPHVETNELGFVI